MSTTPEEDREIAVVQLGSADAEVLAGDIVDHAHGEVELKGRKFRVADSIGSMALLMWAAAADLSTDDHGAPAAIYHMLEDVIVEDEWTAFRHHALQTKATAEDLLGVINKGMELISGTPTEEPSGSSGGRTSTSGTSRASSSRKGAVRSRS